MKRFSDFRPVLLALGIVVSVLALAACAATDVVAKVAKTSFDELLGASSSGLSFDAAEDAYALASPGGDVVYFARDFSRNNSGGKADMSMPDVEFSFDDAPFIAAGLDPAKLKGAGNMAYEAEDGRLMLHFEVSGAAPARSDPASKDPRSGLNGALAAILGSARDRVGYHEKLDHYGIKLGEGNMLEWAKDLSKNDKDLVFVLDPSPLAAAGLDPEALAGWAFAGVEMKDDAGKAVVVDKLLRPFDLR
jgi:hypothetical protein